MADMFGAPIGIQASEENIRRNVLSGMTAARMLGEIEQQPAEKALKEAHARLYTAEAADKETAARAAQSMLDLQTEFTRRQAENLARGELIEESKAAGRTATVADVPARGMIRKSQADTLEAFATFAEDHGVGPLQLAKVYKEIADIHEKEAIALYRGNQAAQTAAKAEREHYEQIGNVAGAAATNPASYMAAMANPKIRALLPPGLTGNFATDRPVLKFVQDSSQDSIKRLDLARKAADDADEKKRREVMNKQSEAQIKLAEARTGVAKARADAITKNGGTGDPSAVAARKTLDEKRRAEMAAKDRKEFPPVPLDPKARSFGQTYTAADGKTKFVWEKDPATGQGVARRLNVAPTASSTAAASAKVAAEAPEESDDIEED